MLGYLNPKQINNLFVQAVGIQKPITGFANRVKIEKFNSQDHVYFNCVSVGNNQAVYTYVSTVYKKVLVITLDYINKLNYLNKGGSRLHFADYQEFKVKQHIRPMKEY